jgi:hypothetical protein
MDALRTRALELLPAVERHGSGALLTIAAAVGPRRSVLRPAEIEAEPLSSALQQQALFGNPPLFARSAGVDADVVDGALVVSQSTRYNVTGRIALWETGDVLIQIPPTRLDDERNGLPALIEEDLALRLRAALGYIAWLLDRIDPTRKLTHVALAARLSGASGYFAWRTRAEHARSPNSGTMAGFGREDRREQPVLLTPAHRPRAALCMDAVALTEDLLALLRRSWKD